MQQKSLIKFLLSDKLKKITKKNILDKSKLSKKFLNKK